MRKKLKERGLTLVELLLTMSIISLLFGSLITVINPPSIFARARDVQRMSDLANLSAAIDHYIIDTGVPPSDVNVMHLSDTLPDGQAGPLESTRQGWIKGDLSKYTRKLFTDPKNTGDLVYRYKHDGIRFEIDAELEYLLDNQINDNGSDPGRYEVGSDLNIM